MRFFWVLQMGVILLGPALLYAWLHRDDTQRAARGAALVLAGTYAVFFAMFAVGEAFADPGGWVAAGGTAAWLVPMVILAMAAWYRPGWAGGALRVLLLGLVAIYVWSGATPEAWTAFEAEHGPVRALVGFGLAGPMAVLGWKRPREAGVMLLVLPLLPTALALLNVARGLGAQGWPIALVTVPAAIIGLLYLLAEVRGRVHHPPGAPA